MFDSGSSMQQGAEPSNSSKFAIIVAHAAMAGGVESDDSVRFPLEPLGAAFNLLSHRHIRQIPRISAGAFRGKVTVG